MDYTNNTNRYNYDMDDMHALYLCGIFSGCCVLSYMRNICKVYYNSLCCRENIENNNIYGIYDEERQSNENINENINDYINDYIKKNISSNYDYGDKCCICLEDIKINDNIGEIYCRHSFHINCIKEWLLINNNKDCPLCRKKIKLLTISN